MHADPAKKNHAPAIRGNQKELSHWLITRENGAARGEWRLASGA
jgi:hypothetical protein